MAWVKEIRRGGRTHSRTQPHKHRHRPRLRDIETATHKARRESFNHYTCFLLLSSFSLLLMCVFICKAFIHVQTLYSSASVSTLLPPSQSKRLTSLLSVLAEQNMFWFFLLCCSVKNHLTQTQNILQIYKFTNVMKSLFRISSDCKLNFEISNYHYLHMYYFTVT